MLIIYWCREERGIRVSLVKWVVEVREVIKDRKVMLEKMDVT